MVFKNRCVLVLWTKVASALEGLRHSIVKELSIVKVFNVPIPTDNSLAIFMWSADWPHVWILNNTFTLSLTVRRCEMRSMTSIQFKDTFTIRKKNLKI